MRERWHTFTCHASKEPLKEHDDLPALTTTLQQYFKHVRVEWMARQLLLKRWRLKEEWISELVVELSMMFLQTYPALTKAAHEELELEHFLSMLPLEELRQHVQLATPTNI